MVSVRRMSRSVSKLFVGALLVTGALTTESLAVNGWRLERTASASAVELSETLTHGSETEATTTETLQTETITEVLKLELHLSARQLYVYRGETLIANYSVAVGREGWNTPTGEFVVFQKQIDPAWEHPFTGEVVPPGPDNPLGTRWIGFWSDGENSIGFHGTPDESVIGTAVSHGCVRMRNEDVLALYEQVSVDTLVTVLP
ncbi:MAG: L,D-transpeptidase [Cyanobacteria bacterium J06635_11]